MSSRILAYRNALIESLKASLGAGYSIEPHMGRFTEESLRQSLTRAPAVYVASLGVLRMSPVSSGEVFAETQMLATAIIKDTLEASRDAGSIAAIEQIMMAVYRGQPGATPSLQVNPPTEMNASNLSNPGLEETGVSIWAVTWRAEILLGEADEFEIGPWGDGMTHLDGISSRANHHGSPDPGGFDDVTP